MKSKIRFVFLAVVLALLLPHCHRHDEELALESGPLPYPAEKEAESLRVRLLRRINAADATLKAPPAIKPAPVPIRASDPVRE